MIVTHNREKLLNSIIYFSENVGLLNKTKLFKLLYYIDFEHFKQTGRSITGLEFQAWEIGPVPVALEEELESPKFDFSERIDIEIKANKKGINPSTNIISKAKFDSTHFTKRELRILKDVSERLGMCSTDDLIRLTHQEGQPWHKVWELEKRHFEKIPYEYILDEAEKDLVKSLNSEREEFITNYR